MDQHIFKLADGTVLYLDNDGVGGLPFWLADLTVLSLTLVEA